MKRLFLFLFLLFTVPAWGQSTGGGLSASGGALPPAASLTQSMAATGFHRSVVWISSFGGLATSTTTTYVWPGSNNNGSEVSSSLPPAVGGTFKNLTCKVNAAPGASNNYTMTLRDSAASVGTPSNLSCQIGAAVTTCTDTTDTYTATTASLMALQIVVTVGGSAPAAQVMRCSIEFDI